MQNIQNATPILTKSLGEMLKLILQENSFQFNGRNSRYRNDSRFRNGYVLKWQ